jgi:hypothetical protein
VGCLHPLRLTDGLEEVWREAVSDEEGTLGNLATEKAKGE